ncbi:polysaccharide biosynthesis/export family protein [Catalinimonas niigatensis]|uniref:polysaccharide biosynthesis/export family protein n=1 Tax=Catalinimonas niigatensis TaxID=1397264 RepID=UPI002666851D|nr:polysaccharide biosynthesis/export family protein [Catalinimonas niigatensis]WPP50271.1 polysaccharide biosynthesis/export family protein [Catalinimonas niigatensis]
MKKRKLPLQFIGMLLLMSMASCYSSKELVYLQNDEFNSQYPTLIKNKRPLYRIQPNDVLNINIQNPDTETSVYFNYGNQEMRGFANPSVFFITGFSVNNEGDIKIPLIGKVKVENLTIDEATQLIQREADRYVRNATVDVKLVSFKISVMGEVNNPGQYYIYNGQATVLEGLSMAGDLTGFGSRTEIKLIRQHDEGVEVVLLDLTDAKLMNSSYYFLLPNDVLYVEPTEEQIRRTNLQPLGIVFSGISALVLITNFLLNNVNLDNGN